MPEHPHVVVCDKGRLAPMLDMPKRLWSHDDTCDAWQERCLGPYLRGT